MEHERYKDDPPFVIPLYRAGFEITFRIIISIALLISCISFGITFFSIIGMALGAYGLYSAYKIISNLGSIGRHIRTTYGKDPEKILPQGDLDRPELLSYHMAWVLQCTNEYYNNMIEKEKDTNEKYDRTNCETYEEGHPIHQQEQ